ncbi:hypothetical protein NKJ93_02320 [Mesorhizobium sp. M0028]|uniref:hypothetical protein n=1 Tax=Mesorhizobium sp. M0028 TaxID=2956849 RepID=UPI003335C44E
MATWLGDKIDNYLASPPDMDFTFGYLAGLADCYAHIRGDDARVQSALALVRGGK